MMSDKFESLPLRTEILKNLKGLNYSLMTPIQEKSLPIVLDGRDIIAQAKTGSGKTAAFGLGLINSLDGTPSRPQSLVLCPTRELAEQVAVEIRTLARSLQNIKVLTITGGIPEYRQEKSIAHGAHIIVGTPGRVLRLMRRKILALDTVKQFVLDEADRMLEMGFIEDIQLIAEGTPSNRQTLLFSATFPKTILDLSRDLQNSPEVVKVDTDHVENHIQQRFFLVDGHREKLDALLRALSHYRPQRFLVFCKTKRITDLVAKCLNDHDIYAEAIHGDLLQNERTEVLAMFSNQSLSALVATDVAARGLDIDNLELVVNYDLPSTSDVYTHRVGRTARAGKTGAAISFFVKQESDSILAMTQNLAQEVETETIEGLPLTQDYDLTPPMCTLYISGGKKDKLRPGDIVGAIVGVAGLDAQNIGDISVGATISFVAVKKEQAEEVVQKLSNGRIKKRKFKIGFV